MASAAPSQDQAKPDSPWRSLHGEKWSERHRGRRSPPARRAGRRAAAGAGGSARASSGIRWWASVHATTSGVGSGGALARLSGGGRAVRPGPPDGDRAHGATWRPMSSSWARAWAAGPRPGRWPSAASTCWSLERGERLPREPQNWSPDEVFLRAPLQAGRARGEDGDGAAFAPGVHYVVGGNTKVYGASLPRFRESDFEEVAHLDGRLARVAVPLRRPRALLRRGRGAVPRARHHRRGPDRAVAQHALPVRRRCPTSPTSPSWSSGCGGRACTRARRRWASTCGPVGVRALRDLRRLPVPARRQVATPRPAPSTPRSRPGRPGWRPGCGCERLVTDASGRRVVERWSGTGRTGPVTVHGRRFVVSAGAANSAALLLASASAEHPDGLANSSEPARPQLHDAQQRPHRRGRREPAQRRGLPEDA